MKVARRSRAIALLRGSLLVAGLAVACAGASAAGASAAPVWRIAAISNTTVAPGGTTTLLVQVDNVGDGTIDAGSSPVTLTARAPTGVQFTATQALTNSALTWNCFGSLPSSSLSCSANSGVIVPPSRGLLRVVVAANPVLLPGSAQTITLNVSGGGAAPDATAVPLVVSSDPLGFGVATVDGQITADAAGTPSTQAGGHPYAASVSFDLNTYRNPDPSKGDAWPVAPLKDAYADLPPGLVGDPSGVGQCKGSELANTNGLDAEPLCPSSSQVGTAVIRMDGTGLLGYTWGPVPVFNMVPPADVPARFGFNVLGSIVTLDATVRSGTDYGITIVAADSPEAIPIAGTTVTLWGSPADSSHGGERACPGDKAPWAGGAICPADAGVPATAFVRNPTSCTAPADSPVQDGLVTSLHVDSWLNPGRLGSDGLPDLTDPAWQSGSFVSHLPPAYPLPAGSRGPHQLPTGCDQVPFDPELSGEPAVDGKPASPSGFSFDLTLPQPNDPVGIGEGDLRAAVVTLPVGVSVSPSSANGLDACSSAQIALHGGVDPACPDASKIGSVEVTTPLLPRPLDGSVYLAAQGDNPFGSLLAIYIVAHGPGVVLKLPGHVEADPITGQLTTTFDNNPQLPFTRLHLAFDGGPRAALVLPAVCGSYTTHATLMSWSGKTVPWDSTFSVGGDASDCSAGTSFAPGFAAGTENPVAGGDSTFRLRLTRSDRDQQLAGITVNMPSGLTGRIANAELCGEAAAAAGSCPAGSQIGSVTVGAGAGEDPFYISSGRAYLTGPYKGAPFGLSIVVPAKAGPFDLGDVVVRSALLVDKHTANVSVISDPLPTILQGIPLDVRDVRVSVDKPHFFVNPTSCARKTIYGTFGSTAGATAHASAGFQVGQCQKLGLKPRMVLTVGAKHHTAAGTATPLTTTLTMPRGPSTNLRFVKVSLPATLNAHLDVINQACTRPQFEAGHCAQAKAGSAVAYTPLLRAPLRGSAYFVKNGHPIPDLFIALRGQVAFDLIGRVSIPGGTHLATTFKSVPDVPITRFTLQLTAGSRGTVGAAVNLCSTRGRTGLAGLIFGGQNGRVLVRQQPLVIHGCPKPKHGKKPRHHG